jgi:hypothetical protein
MLKTITTVDEYDAATQRIAELESFPEGTPEADELGELVAAVMEWDSMTTQPRGRREP